MARRRYRLFTICAVVIIFMLYRVVQNSWDDTSRYDELRSPSSPKFPAPFPPADDQTRPRKEEPPQVPLGEHDKAAGDQTTTSSHRIANQGKPSEGDTVGVKVPTLKNADGQDESNPPRKTIKAPGGDDNARPAATTPATNRNGPVEDDGEAKAKYKDEDEDELEIHWTKPPRNTQLNQANTARPKVHWTPVSEHFPVPTESLIALPTAKPKKIPKIQHEFGIESPGAKTQRIQRLVRVRKEIERAWAGYRKFAWMHDELSPVSGRYRDPFCGWAATLVDSLDTLWIAGLKDEFNEAANAVKDIDFTYTPRMTIPVFETVIRYLGGLLGAFDVSGGHDGGYPILLEKAVELAEILMGAFDTPNRMPILQYNWMPVYSAEPHRASIVGIAELGTLSMEFTRLAQLTGQNKYYDAVDRITDALVELQKAGTAIPGLFPERLNASGCNRTIIETPNALSKEAQKQLDSDELSEEPDGYAATKGSWGYSDSKKTRRSRSDHALERRGTIPAKDKGAKGGNRVPTHNTPESKPRQPPFSADGSTFKWDCTSQGLVPSETRQKFHMGGSQDSAYEYFPKEYLLLGGLESKYKKLHEDAIDAIDKWLLYRPMNNDDWDILFPAAVSINTGGHRLVDPVPSFQITHLTCFVGGMYALGGKIFGREKDVETAKKLTDGCVWAYQVTPSGIMPESCLLLPCPTLEKCEFNETLWWEKLDPHKKHRAAQIAQWEQNTRQLAEKQAKAQQKDNGANSVDAGEERVKDDAAETLKQTAQDASASSLEDMGPSSPPAAHRVSGSSKFIHKRAAVPAGGEEGASGYDDADKGSELPQSLKNKLGLKDNDRQSQRSKNSKGIKKETGSAGQKGSKAVNSVLEANRPPRTLVKMPQKPLSHEEYVTGLIEASKLPPGFMRIPDKRYILRPEAIESVWYMYRITGDPSWMEKGWAMFEATIQATRTEIANSAVDNVSSDEPKLTDEMESFWLAETLKYYYLLFAGPEVISLDKWVLNTEAHPFKRPT